MTSSEKTELNPKAYFEHLRDVAEGDIDELGHVNNAVYLRYVEACGRAHSDGLGLTLEVFREHGVVPVIRKHEITYHRPATLGDRLLISTQVAKIGGPRAVRHNQVRLAEDETLLVDAVTEWVWLDPESGRPKRVPQKVLEAFGF